MIAHLLRAVFRAIDRRVDDMVTAALDTPTLPDLQPVTAADFDWPADECPIFDELSTDQHLAAVMDGIHGVDDFLWLCGEDVR